MAGGWVKAWRKMLDTPALQRPLPFFIFNQFLLKAAYTRTEINWRGQMITLERGQLAISVRAWCREFEQPYKAVRVAIEKFEREDMLTVVQIRGAVKGAGKGAVGALVTICNYEQYQVEEAARGAVEGALWGAPLTKKKEEGVKNLNKPRRGDSPEPLFAPGGATPSADSTNGQTQPKTKKHPLPDPPSWEPKIWAELKAVELLNDNRARYRRVLDEFREYEAGRGREMADWNFVFVGFVRKEVKWAGERADEQDRFAQARARMALEEKRR